MIIVLSSLYYHFRHVCLICCRVLGRRNSALISIILVLLGGFAATLSQSYWLFVFIRLFIAIGN